MKKYMTGLAVVLFSAAACNSTKIETPVSYGRLAVSLASEPIVEVKTKADVNTSGFTVSVYDDAQCSGTPVYGPVKCSEFGTQLIQVGKDYYVTAENCTEADAEYCTAHPNGQPRYYGKSEAVKVSATGETATAQVNCSVSNALVTVVFESSVYGPNGVCRFEDLKVTLNAFGEPADQTPRNTKTAGAPAAFSEDGIATYFNPCTLKYTISGKYTATGSMVSQSFDDGISLAAKSNIELRVRVNENGQLTAAVTVDRSISDTVTETETFNPYE